MKTMHHSLRFASGLAALCALAAPLLAGSPPAPDFQYRNPAAIPNPVVARPDFSTEAVSLTAVKLAFTVSTKGVPSDIRIVSSSGSIAVDREAVRTVRRQRFESAATPRAETMVVQVKLQS